MKFGHLAAAMLALAPLPATAAITYAGNVVVPGEASDLSGLAGPNGSRLSFGSDLFYDKASDLYYGITDRGPGGGLIDYAPRVNIFKLKIDPATGAPSNFVQQKTVIFKGPDGQPLSGLNPGLLPGGKAVLGKAFDSEGFVRRANGNFLVSDEYGPSIYEFTADGDYVRKFTTPANIVPRQPDGNGGTVTNYVDGRGVITSGRQDNRGFEGLTLSHDGKTAYAILQDPLVDEGAQNEGRRSRNTRIVAFDVATGTATGQFIYQLDNVTAINNGIPGTADDFSGTDQGRSIGVSAIYALSKGKFLVIERDNRGIGVDDPTATLHTIGSKRVYLIDINGATDVSGISLAGSNSLPTGITAVTKTLFLDVDAALKAAGATVAEKIEGLTIGRDLNGGVSLLLATDNDFSVTQTGAGVQFDVCTSGVGGTATKDNVFGGGCPAGQSLLPSYVYGFKLDGADAAAVAVPEPATWALMVAGFGLVGGVLRRRVRTSVAA